MAVILGAWKHGQSFTQLQTAIFLMGPRAGKYSGNLVGLEGVVGTATTLVGGWERLVSKAATWLGGRGW